MNPEQFKTFLEFNEKATGAAVEKFVNGHMREMNTKLDDHIVKHDKSMEVILPLIQGITGMRVVGKVVMWLAAVGVAWMAIKNFKL